MNYQSCTLEELTSLFEGGDSYAAHEIARRVSEGLLEDYEVAFVNLEQQIETGEQNYEDLLEEETRLNQTIEELKESLSDSYSDKDYEVSNLVDEVSDLESEVSNLEGQIVDLESELGELL